MARKCSSEEHGLANWNLCIGEMPDFNQYLDKLQFDPKSNQTDQGFCYVKPATVSCSTGTFASSSQSDQISDNLAENYQEKAVRWVNEITGNQNNFDFLNKDNVRYWPGGYWGPGSDIEISLCCKKVLDHTAVEKEVKVIDKVKREVNHENFDQHLDSAHKVLKSRLSKGKSHSDYSYNSMNYNLHEALMASNNGSEISKIFSFWGQNQAHNRPEHKFLTHFLPR